MKRVNVGIIGLGTVGTGVFNLLGKNSEIIQRRTPCEIVITKVADKRLEENSRIELGEVEVSTDAEIVNDPEIDIVVELIGGYTKAKEIILAAFAAGKHVVTANKALLAVHGEEIFEAARKNNAEIGYEAAVGGGIPIIKAIKEGLCANNILSFYGIINGTSNYILTKMTEEGKDFQTMLLDAQEKGFAEADPAFDVDGIDAAHKLLLLVNLAFGSRVKMDDIYAEGIARISLVDIEFAREFHYKIKPLIIAKMIDGELEARVHPTMVPDDYLIASVDGVFNAVFISGDFVGETLFYGKGAGMEPTASAVVADIIDIARNRCLANIQRVPVMSFNDDERKDLRVRTIDEVVSVYYLRFMVTDVPGVLSKISGMLGKYNISISKVIQRVRREGEHVPVVIVTHRAVEKDIRMALKEVMTLDECGEEPVLIRVEGGEI